MPASLFADWKSALTGRSDHEALPVMDGPLTPNGLLDEAVTIGDPVPACDDLACAGDGTLFVSSGSRILALSGPEWRERRIHAELEGTVSALCVNGPDLYAGVEGHGLLRLEQGRVVARLEAVGGKPLRCVTAILPLPDGRLAVAEGSSANLPGQWCRDLMERRALGRVILVSKDLREAETLRDDLAWPYGLGLGADQSSLWVSESWRHRVVALPLMGKADREPQTVIRNLPGYPARLAADGAGGWWLSVFALRTHLVELVLRETRYREEMLAKIDPRFWIAPSLRATGHYLEPLQGGGIKKLGLIKPWAPPRSYGLAVQVSGSGELLRSLHSRVGGLHHGVTSARMCGDRLVVSAKGSDRLLLAPT